MAEGEIVPKPCTYCSADNTCLRRAMAAGQIYYSFEKGITISSKLVQQRDIPPTLYKETRDKGIFVGNCLAKDTEEQTTCCGYTTRPRWHPPKTKSSH